MRGLRFQRFMNVVALPTGFLVVDLHVKRQRELAAGKDRIEVAGERAENLFASPLAASEIAPLAKPKYHGQKTEMVCTIGYRVVLAADGAHANPSDRENTRLDRSLADKLDDLTHVDAFIQIARILNREMRHLQTPNKSSAFHQAK